MSNKLFFLIAVVAMIVSISSPVFGDLTVYSSFNGVEDWSYQLDPDFTYTVFTDAYGTSSIVRACPQWLIA